MKYVALLSGGKDSCFNLAHCEYNGHELIAAASLRPVDGKEELDSYLYQTVGQDAIEIVGQALGVPLYRGIITGSAIEQGSEYGGRESEKSNGHSGDETEDLYTLLSLVKSHHPDVKGVSVGAILSNYQRVRVEHVCLRLSLVPLCYLWQRNQEHLLSEMINSGVEAILIKVAGIGLMEKHLGKTLRQMQPTLKRLNDLYGSHICGEGGEYESLTLDCSMFKKRIQINEVETVIHSDSDFATVAFLRIKDASLEEKEPNSAIIIPIPPLLSENYDNLPQVMQSTEELPPCSDEVQSRPSNNNMFGSQTNDKHNLTGVPFQHPSNSIIRGQWVIASSLQKPYTQDVSIVGEVKQCFTLLQEHLSKHNISYHQIAFINILISDMQHFATINEVYKTYFGTSPPARACVAVDLPDNINVQLDCIAYAEEAPTDREALHVQSLSYWAPANIGPYSQAIRIHNRIYVSGQIGMIPSNLSLPDPPNFALETALSLQHLDRIVKALQESRCAKWNPVYQSMIFWVVDVSKIGQLRRLRGFSTSLSSVPTLFVGIKALPKGAQIETQAIAHTGLFEFIDSEDGTIEAKECDLPEYEEGIYSSDSCDVHWEISSFRETDAFSAVIVIRGDLAHGRDILSEKIDHKRIWSNSYSLRLFYSKPMEDEVDAIKQLFPPERMPAITCIPSRFLSTMKLSCADLALVLVGGMGK